MSMSACLPANYEFASRGVAGLELGCSPAKPSKERRRSGFDRQFRVHAGRAHRLVTPITPLYGRPSYAGIRPSAPGERWAGSADEAWLNGYQTGVGFLH